MIKQQKRLAAILKRCTEQPDGCLLWQGFINKKGYGAAGHISGAVTNVHRIVYELSHNVILPSNIVVRHTCDVRNCCNINHLLKGSQQDNVDDCKSRGRLLKAFGTSHGNSKLNDAIVLSIRADYANGTTITNLSHLHNIHTSTVFGIVHNKSWTHLV